MCVSMSFADCFIFRVVLLTVLVYTSALFSKENKLLNAQSGPKFGRRGGGISYIDSRKKVLERHSDLHPSEKELPNGVPAYCVTKTPLVYTYNIGHHLLPNLLQNLSLFYTCQHRLDI
jgi:hypothetical protein